MAGRDGKHDTGIDLVAVDKLTGDNVAIQCRFFPRTPPSVSRISAAVVS